MSATLTHHNSFAPPDHRPHFSHPSNMSLAPSTFSPVDVVKTDDITIQEYFGNVSSHHHELSACVVSVEGGSEEAFQIPGFDEVRLSFPSVAVHTELRFT